MSNVLSTSIAVASGSAAPSITPHSAHHGSSAEQGQQIAQAVANGDPAVVVNISNSANSIKQPASYGRSRRTDQGRGSSGRDREGKEKVEKEEGAKPPKPVGPA